MAYYAWAVLQLPADAPAPIVVVPSGNLGNVTAGLLAARRGVPIARFVAATTVNDPLPRYLASGRFEPAAAVPTLANAMDVGHPSNFERLEWLFGGDLEAMRRAVLGVAVTDDEIRAAMREMADHGYIADPHTAVGWVGAQAADTFAAPDSPRIVLATAHPAKFGDVVAPVLGRDLPCRPRSPSAWRSRPRRSPPARSWPPSSTCWMRWRSSGLQGRAAGRTRRVRPRAAGAVKIAGMPSLPDTLTPERSAIDPAYTWDLSAIFPSWEAWDEAMTDLEQRIGAFKAFAGTLGRAPRSFAGPRGP